MTLKEYLAKSENWENIIRDKDYDIEIYLYKPDEDKELDKWDASMDKLAELLTVTEFDEKSATINFSELIESKINELDAAGLFIDCEIDEIMEDMDVILTGGVSEKWLKKFVDVLEEE